MLIHNGRDECRWYGSKDETIPTANEANLLNNKPPQGILNLLTDKIKDE